MAFTITPTSYTELLHILKENDIPCTPPSSDVLAARLEKEIGHPLLTPALLKHFGLIYLIDIMPYNSKTSAFIDSVREAIKLPPGSLYRRCSNAFKDFCGPENLTSSGGISRDAALDYIIAYANRKGLGERGMIYLDDALKSALNVEISCLSSAMLPELIEDIFK